MVMKSSYLRLTGMWVRIVLLVITLLACATLLLWQFGGSWVNQFDGFVVKTYQGHYQSRLSKAVTILSRSPSEGVTLLDELLVDLRDVSKRDRLERLKRRTLKQLVQALETKGDIVQALDWAERWVDFDKMDIYAQLWLSRLLSVTPGREDEGRILLGDIYKKMPESPVIIDEYAERLFEEGKVVEAFLAASRTYATQDSLKGQLWQVFWDTGEGFNAKQKMSIMPPLGGEDRIILPFEVPGTVRRLRVDPPIASRIVIAEPRMIRMDANQEYTLNLWEVSLGLVDISKQGTELTTSGGDDPYFFWTLPPELTSHPGVFSGRVEAYLEEAYPAVMERIAALPEGDTLDVFLNEMAESEALRHLQVIRERQKRLQTASLKGKKLEFFWKSPGEVFVAERRVKADLVGSFEEDRLRFDVSAPLDKSLAELRIDLPDIVGVEYTIEFLEILGGKGLQRINLSVVNTVQEHMVERDGARFRVIGVDPYFSVILPGGVQVVDSVRIRGMGQ